MQINSYKTDMQNDLEKFLNIMFECRNMIFDPDGRHKDLRNIQSVYIDKGGGYWMLTDGSLIIGTAALKILNTNDGIGEVKCMFVHPQYQGKGLGKKLLNHVIQEAKLRKLGILRLDALRNAEKALNLYRNTGFYEISRYNENFVAEVFMELKI